MTHTPRAEAGGCPPALLSGPVGRTLLFFSLPALGSCVLQSVNGTINAIWVGRLLGEQAIAATSSASMISMAVSSIMFGLGSAVSALIGQGTGRGDVDEVRRVYATALSLFLLSGIVLSLLGCWFTPEMLRWVATPADVYPAAERYLGIHFASLPATFSFVLLMMVLRGAGNLQTPLWYMGFSVGLDVLLNPILIAGFGPVPAFGIAGSAMAGLLSAYCSALGLAAHIHIRACVPRLNRAIWNRAEIRQSLPILRSIFEKGSLMSVQLMIMSITGVVLLSLVNQFGSATAAAYGAVRQLWMFIQMPASALAMAVGSMAALNIGARQWDRLQAIARSGTGIAMLIGVGIAIMSLLFERPLLSLFLQRGESFEVAMRINVIGIWSMVISGMSLVPSAVVRANGAVQMPVLVSLFSIVLVKLGFAFGLRSHLGSDAIWWSLVVGSVCSFCLLSAYHRWGDWRSLRLLRVRDDAGMGSAEQVSGSLLRAATSR